MIMIKKNKINPDDLKVIKKTDTFKVEEVGDNTTGEIHNEMFIDGFMSVDEILYIVKKYSVEKAWYRVGTNRTHTFPLIIKLRGDNDENKFGDVEFSFPIVSKDFMDDSN